MCLNFAEIGQRIRTLRKQRGYTQEKLAEAADLSVPYLSHIERGKKGVSLVAIIRIAAALDVSLEYLLFGRQSTDTAAKLSADNSPRDSSEVRQLLEAASDKERQFLLETIQSIRQNLRNSNLIP